MLGGFTTLVRRTTVACHAAACCASTNVQINIGKCYPLSEFLVNLSTNQPINVLVNVSLQLFVISLNRPFGRFDSLFKREGQLATRCV